MSGFWNSPDDTPSERLRKVIAKQAIVAVMVIALVLIIRACASG